MYDQVINYTSYGLVLFGVLLLACYCSPMWAMRTYRIRLPRRNRRTMLPPPEWQERGYTQHTLH